MATTDRNLRTETVTRDAVRSKGEQSKTADAGKVKDRRRRPCDYVRNIIARSRGLTIDERRRRRRRRTHSPHRCTLPIAASPATPSTAVCTVDDGLFKSGFRRCCGACAPCYRLSVFRDRTRTAGGGPGAWTSGTRYYYLISNNIIPSAFCKRSSNKFRLN